MKRKLVCLFAALFVVASLAACRNRGDVPGGDTSTPIAVDVWTYYNGAQASAFNDLIAEFNESVGAKKNIVVEQKNKGGVNELIAAVLASAAGTVGAEKMPAMFAAYADTAYAVDKLGKVVSLDSYLTSEELDKYIPGYVEEGRFDTAASLKIFPIAKSTEILMLNKTDWEKFAAAENVTTSALETIEGVTEVAAKYYDWSGGKAFFGRDVMANYIIIGFKQLGEEIFQVSGGEVTYNLNKEIFRKLWDNFYTPYVLGHFAAGGKFRSDDIRTGNIISMVCSTSGATYFPKQVIVNDTESYPIEPLALPLPYFAGGSKVAVQQGAGMVVSKTDARTEAACVEFLKWFTEKERNIKFSVDSGYLPVRKDANDLAAIYEVMGDSVSGSNQMVVQTTLPVSVGMVQDYAMYTSKAFESGTAARNFLEDSLLSKAALDATAIVAAAEAQGVSRAEAAAPYLGDDDFEAWFSAFSAGLTALGK